MRRFICEPEKLKEYVVIFNYILISNHNVVIV
jgi:hypothetical protein